MSLETRAFVATAGIRRGSETFRTTSFEGTERCVRTVARGTIRRACAGKSRGEVAQVGRATVRRVSFRVAVPSAPASVAGSSASWQPSEETARGAPSWAWSSPPRGPGGAGANTTATNPFTCELDPTAPGGPELDPTAPATPNLRSFVREERLPPRPAEAHTHIWDSAHMKDTLLNINLEDTRKIRDFATRHLAEGEGGEAVEVGGSSANEDWWEGSEEARAARWQYEQ
eukprot:517657-Prorocentrum_minimum.AAC.1